MPNDHRENEKQRRDAAQGRDNKKRGGDPVEARDDKKRRGYVAQAREDEKQRRDAAQASVAEVEQGGHEVAGRSIKQMVSVRLEAQLLQDLRHRAEQQDVSISDLLRQAAVELLERSRTTFVHVHYRRSEAPFSITGSLTTGRQITSGFFAPIDDTQVSGNEPVDVLTG